MSAQCQACGGRAQLFLCHQCQSQLRQMLADLPWWIDRLAEAAVGQAKLGDRGRHTRSEPEGLAEYADPIEGDDRLQRAIAGGKFGRDRVLAAGKVNAHASRLLSRVQNSLTTIVQDVSESRGIVLPPHLTAAQRTGVAACTRLAQWLSANLGAISGDQGAGQTFTQIRGLIGDERHDGEITKAVNRPMPMRFLGKCPTWVEDKRQACGVELRCRQDAIEIYCRSCRQTHNPDRLQLLLMKDLERKKITISKILEVNRMQPEEFQISERMIRHWRQEGKLKPRGYRRVDGREVITRHSDDDVPLYLWEDVRKLRAEVPQRKAKAG